MSTPTTRYAGTNNMEAASPPLTPIQDPKTDKITTSDVSTVSGDCHPRPVDTQLAHAARRPHLREELVEDLDNTVRVLWPQKQGVHHDGVAELGATSAQDR